MGGHTAKEYLTSSKDILPVSESYWLQTEFEFQVLCQELYIEARLKRLRHTSEEDAHNYKVYMDKKKALKAERAKSNDKKLKKIADLDMKKPCLARHDRWLAEYRRATTGQGMDPKDHQETEEYKQAIITERQMREDSDAACRQKLLFEGLNPDTGVPIAAPTPTSPTIPKRRLLWSWSKPTEPNPDDGGPIAPHPTTDEGHQDMSRADSRPDDDTVGREGSGRLLDAKAISRPGLFRSLSSRSYTSTRSKKEEIEA